MKFEVLILMFCLSASFATKMVDVNKNDESLKPLSRKPRLIGLGIIGGIGIVGGGPGSEKEYIELQKAQEIALLSTNFLQT